ncbi:unnamed protein product [Peronospora effusa]|uniref:FYVE-type domain-containing protein n=1 Tax=Peronospora effusa TaxID=542832 RepID=A0A3M6VF91_9STRA|nr:hypothetical protein DD238_007751 [Peronospora effusa]RQM11980.1 hypothetical protein DD237_008488 [Peronospora effusa]CAI5703780.1 unnamed protein product [Peronospora effusa]
MNNQFPLQETVFPPLQLSDASKGIFVNTALMQLTRALRDYDKYQRWQASRPPSLRYQLHPAMWKPIKTCEQLTVYRRVPADDAVVTAPARGSRRRARSRTLEAMRLATCSDSGMKNSVTDSSWPLPARGSAHTANSEWTMPTLLQVGTIEGTLDDVMYGSSSYDPVSTLIESSYTGKEVVDADILYEFQGPSPDEPFRFLGLKWVVKSTSSTVRAFEWPRDLTFLAATGVLHRQSGERVGYHLMHSVDLGRNYGPLEGKRIVRGRVSSCYLYRQTSTNSVDVYMKTNFEPNGSVHESVALMSAADRLTYCSRSLLCAQNKKLSWLLAHPKPDETKAGSARPSPNRVKKRNDCGVCTRPIGTFSRGHSCRVCSARTCSACCVKKKLIFPGQRHKTLEQRSIVVCTHCLTHARKLASVEVAKQEVAERKHLNRRRGTLRGSEASTRNNRCRSNSHFDINKLRRGIGSRRRAEVEKFVLTDPCITSTLDQTNSQTKLAWNYYSETEDNDDDDDAMVSLNEFQLLLDSQSRTPNTRTRSDSKRVIAKSTNDAPIPIAAQQDIWDVDSEAQGEYDYGGFVMNSQSMSLHSEVPILGTSLPEAVVQYAWGEAVLSPVNQKTLDGALPSPSSSPLPSMTLLPKNTEVTWPSAKGDQATMRTLPVPKATIPRIHAGASTQEVLAQFEELCNAAENVYQAARKHTTVQPATTRFDMSAVD